MRTIFGAIVLTVLMRVVGRRFWRWWRYYGAAELPAELVRRSQ